MTSVPVGSHATSSFLINNPFELIIAMTVEILTDHLYILLYLT